MEADSHDPVRGIKGFLDAISMMHIDVNVQDSVVITLSWREHVFERQSIKKCVPQKLQDAEDDI